MNKTILIGNICNDLELKNTQSGKSVCSFTLAVRRDKDNSDFISCVAWGKTAEILVQYALKGTKIAVEGRINTRNYDDKDGKKIYVTEVFVERIELLSSKPKQDGQAISDNQLKREIEQGRKTSMTAEEIDQAYVDFGETIELTDDDIAF